MSIDAAEAKLSLSKLPWVESARISKIYPDKLEIEIEERAAFALWQQGEAVTVIQADGKVIGGYAADARLAALPLLVGKGAEEEGRVFIDQVARYQDVAARVKAYIRVGTRRWDLRLDNGMTIRLPASGVDHALGRLTAMQAELGVFERDLAAIDLRVSDRTVFALTENAAIKRKDFVSSRRDAATKVRKARGSRI
ncbi:MAG: cell division protein FtsQ/DivIB [Ahrensia sp.]|nr:cell division protein FtsQ/DivIB [Ahrensia sp.]